MAFGNLLQSREERMKRLKKEAGKARKEVATMRQERKYKETIRESRRMKIEPYKKAVSDIASFVSKAGKKRRKLRPVKKRRTRDIRKSFWE